MPHVAANCIELFYDLTGPADAPLIVFSNSLGTALEMWDGVIGELAGPYRCLRYDARGHGRSQVVDAPASIEDLAEDLRGLLDVLDVEKAHVVGLSIGGMIAQAFTLRHPERVASLALLSTTAYLPSPESWAERSALVRAQGTSAVVEATLGRWFTPEFRRDAPEATRRVREQFVNTDRAAYAVCCGAIGTMDLREKIGAITAPTLVMNGAQDPTTTPAMGEDLRSRIADSELVVLSRAAHLLAVEQPEAVAAYLTGFIARRGRAGKPDMDLLAAGLANRQAVLGREHVERSFERGGAFGTPWQQFITRTAWGEIWGDPALPWKTRSLLTLTMMAALHREEEFKLHLRPALGNGVTREELRAMLMQTAVYAGVPAANAAFRWVNAVLGEDFG